MPEVKTCQPTILILSKKMPSFPTSTISINFLHMGYNNNGITSIPYAFIKLGVGYLCLGLLLGVVGSKQYLQPLFLKDKLGFQQVRPLHVYLVISWIFTAAQGATYYYVQKTTSRGLRCNQLAWIHFVLQVMISLLVVYNFFAGNFSGREYLEFPVWIGAVIIVSWVPFAFNIFATLKPRYKEAPVFYFSWTAGIVFFFITIGEAYLWQFSYFNNNIIRDVTVQWKAMGSMVGAWNMLIYGCSMCSMSMMTRNKKFAYNKTVFLFFFIGLGNLMFNWGHHTYTVPAQPWVRQVAFIVSMTELVLLGNIILRWRKGMKNNMQLKYKSAGKVLLFADSWILINLLLAIAISIPALNYYTHGTHITVAHAMGATIGINTLLLFSVIYHIADEEGGTIRKGARLASSGVWMTNISLLVFFFTLLAAGVIKLINLRRHIQFTEMMIKSRASFVLLTVSGTVLMIGLVVMSFAALHKMNKINKPVLKRRPKQLNKTREPLLSTAK